MKRHLLAAALLVASVLTLGGAAGAYPGDLDPSFGSAGSVPMNQPGWETVTASSVTLQADGKPVVTFDGVRSAFAVRRYLPDGKPDETFGAGGTATAVNQAGSIMSTGAKAFNAAVQPDGKIVVVGTAQTVHCSPPGTYTNCVSAERVVETFAVARFNTDGSLDQGFGVPYHGFTGESTGSARTLFHREGGRAHAVAIQPDGKIVAAGAAYLGQTSQVAVARYNADGTPDPSFGDGGAVTTAVGPSSDAASVLLQPDGKIVVAGETADPAARSSSFLLARYQADGSPDSSFGNGGTVTTTIGVASGARAAVLRTDGTIVAAGFTRPSGDEATNHRFALVGYAPDGTPAAGFGKSGTVTTQVRTSAEAHSLVLQPDGTLVAGGRTFDDGSYGRMTLVLYRANGSLGSDFGQGGRVTVKSGITDGAYGLALQPDGKLIGAGKTVRRFAGSQGVPVRTKVSVSAPEKVTYPQSIKYKIKVSNTGSNNARNVRVTFVIPPGVDAPNAGMTPADECAFVSRDARAMGVSTVSCDLGALASKTTRTVTVTVRPIYVTDSPVKNTTFVTTNDRELSPTSATQAKTSVKVVCPKKGPCPGP